MDGSSGVSILSLVLACDCLHSYNEEHIYARRLPNMNHTKLFWFHSFTTRIRQRATRTTISTWLQHTRYRLTQSRVGLLGYKHNEAAAAKLSELLQKDLDVSHPE